MILRIVFVVCVVYSTSENRKETAKIELKISDDGWKQKSQPYEKHWTNIAESMCDWELLGKKNSPHCFHWAVGKNNASKDKPNETWEFRVHWIAVRV
jgi:hypothetical protein